MVLDVGGGSTELVTDGFRTSLDIGSVRLTERFLHGDPPTQEQLSAAARAVQDLLPPLAAVRAVGVAGTVAQLALLAGANELRLVTVEGLLDGLASQSLEERRRVRNLDPKRAPVIVGGALIVREVLRRYALTRIRFSVRDLLDGAALEAAALPPAVEGSAPPGAYTCC
jgi:exopolyphosphatase/guanosine-5'-triphosphate,3'-diphosphate pyrophosphatase